MTDEERKEYYTFLGQLDPTPEAVKACVREEFGVNAKQAYAQAYNVAKTNQIRNLLHKDFNEDTMTLTEAKLHTLLVTLFDMAIPH